MDDLKSRIRNVPDFPQAGIVFRDITTLLQDQAAFRQSIDGLAARYRDRGIELVVGAEARGFIFGAALAYTLGTGFVPVRKPGKLPGPVIRHQYALEYGTDTLEMHADAIRPGQRVLVADDLLATGGTVAAVCGMVEKLGGDITGVVFLIELTFLKGRAKLTGRDVFSLVQYDTE